MSLSVRLKKQLGIALGSKRAGVSDKHLLASELAAVIGIKGGFALNSDGTLKAGSVVGDFTVQANAEGNAGENRIRFNPKLDKQIKNIMNIKTSGFTPRGPTVAETSTSLVTGWGQDSQGWYVTIVCATLNGAANPTPPQGFVIGVDIALILENGLDYNNY